MTGFSGYRVITPCNPSQGALTADELGGEGSAAKLLNAISKAWLHPAASNVSEQW